MIHVLRLPSSFSLLCHHQPLTLVPSHSVGSQALTLTFRAEIFEDPATVFPPRVPQDLPQNPFRVFWTTQKL